MTEVTSTAARIVKKSLWKDIQRWIDKDYESGPLEIDTHNKRKFLPRALELTKKNDGDFYAGAVLTELRRYPS